MKLTFLGAAGEVTGSQHLLETDTLRILLDCGLFQGRRAEAYAKNRHSACAPSQLDAVILSHAHIDHSGNLPGLFRAGFRGPIYCTSATADLAAVMLKDGLHIQQEDARYLSGQLASGGPLVEPLYGEEEVHGVVKLLEPLEVSDWHELSPVFRVRLTNAGHILGSAVCQFDIEEFGERKRVVFTGDWAAADFPFCVTRGSSRGATC